MGSRQDPVSGGDDFHAGLDIAGEKGQPIYATAEGRVSQAGYQGAYGNLVVVNHGFGLETKYGHLSSFTVKPGQNVKRGDVIGRLGATGRATGYTCTTKSARTAVSSIRCSCSPSRSRALSNSPSPNDLAVSLPIV